MCVYVYIHRCCSAAKLCLTLLGLHGLQPSKFLCPWDFPGKNTGVGCHFLLQGWVSHLACLNFVFSFVKKIGSTRTSRLGSKVTTDVRCVCIFPTLAKVQELLIPCLQLLPGT